MRHRNVNRPASIPGQTLLRELSSRDNDIATAAAVRLRTQRRLVDGSLKNIDLRGANLAGVDLRNAVLDDADAAGAELSRAQLGTLN